MQVRCNGPDKHINTLDLDALLKPQVVYRGRAPEQEPPERTVLPCKACTGRVIVTREMIQAYQEYLRNQSESE